MTTQVKPNWKKIIDLVIVILTAIGSFIGGNVSAKNGFKVQAMLNQKIENYGVQSFQK